MRHARQIMLREIGGGGQNRLARASIALVGTGGLGGPAGLYLAAAGMGRIVVIDPDVVEASNLQRQVQFGEADLGQPKAEVFARRLRALDAGVDVLAQGERLDAANANRFLSEADVILDGTDDFATRFVINAASRALGAPLVSGAVAGWSAQVAVFNASPDAPCYRCFVPRGPSDAAACETVGIVGAVAGLAGSVMALEAVKLITGAGEGLCGRLWLYDGLRAEGRNVRLRRDPGCPECGEGPR